MSSRAGVLGLTRDIGRIFIVHSSGAKLACLENVSCRELTKYRPVVIIREPDVQFSREPNGNTRRSKNVLSIF